MAEAPDPVSWLMIEPGWNVEAADSEEVGRVEEVLGDSTIDIFDGLSIASGMFARPRYVPAEVIAEITEGRVRLQLTREEIDRLGEFKEPAVQEQLSSERASRLQRIEQVVDPTVERGHRVGLVRRALEWLGLAGRR
jgi:hypothetical protein